jgi:anti-sigma B factor antagonist
MSLETSIDSKGTARVITAVGEIDVSCCGDFARTAYAEIDAGHTELVIDMSDVVFVDSTGLGALIAIRKRALAADGSLTLAEVDPLVVRTISITGLDKVFEMVETLDEAITAAPPVV